jgi:hypothetical protein
MSTSAFIRTLAERRWSHEARVWFEAAADEIARGVDDARFAALYAQASRHARANVALAPSDEDRAKARELLAGFEPERWNVLEATRVALVLARPDLAEPSTVRALGGLFQFADVGEHAALLKALPHLPAPERFLDRAREGVRSNMRVLFESIACDSPYPARCFDAPAFRQLAIKALFVEAPLWRVFGFDERVDAELARMALDLADERRSAARPVNPYTWMCLGNHGGKRGLESLERELGSGSLAGRAAAVLALARAGERAKLDALVAPDLRTALDLARSGRADSQAFRLVETLQGIR